MTTQALEKTTTGAMTLGAQYGYTPEYVQLIKDTYAKDATDNELQMFLDVCHHTKLNPMNKEIYFWKQSGKVIIHTGIDGHRLAAERTGRYAPGPPIKRTVDANGNHTASTAYVRKKVGSDWFVIEETAHMSEWRKDGSPFWKNANTASHQLDVTAERHALKKAFPTSFSALAMSGPNGDANAFLDDSANDTPEQKAQRTHLIDSLLKIGKLFCNDDQYRALEATVSTSALPVLEERYTNAIVKLREYVLGEIGKKLHGEAYSAFMLSAFPSGIDATDADEFFAGLDRLATVEPGEVVETPSAPVAATDKDADEERAAIEAEAVSPEEAELIELREKVMEKIMSMANGDNDKVDELLDGRVVPNMSKPQLEKFLITLNNSDAPF